MTFLEDNIIKRYKEEGAKKEFEAYTDWVNGNYLTLVKTFVDDNKTLFKTFVLNEWENKTK